MNDGALSGNIQAIQMQIVKSIYEILAPNPSQIATQNFSSESILDRYPEQHIKNAPESTLGKYA